MLTLATYNLFILVQSDDFFLHELGLKLFRVILPELTILLHCFLEFLVGEEGGTLGGCDADI